MNSEWDCLFKAKDGNSEAWRELVTKHQSRLTALALLVTGSASVAKDIVQDTFMQAITATVRHRDGSLMGFLGTIAYRLALKESKRQRRDVAYDSRDGRVENRTPLDELLTDERDRMIVKAIRSLDTPQRDVLILRFYGGHSYEDIAQLLQIPLGTVKSRIFNGVKSCREILKEKGVLE